MTAKAGLTVKQANPAVEKKVKNVEVTLLVDQQKLNVPQRLRRKTSSKRISWKKGRVKKSEGDVVEIRIAKGCGKVMNDRRKKTKFY